MNTPRPPPPSHPSPHPLIISLSLSLSLSPAPCQPVSLPASGWLCIRHHRRRSQVAAYACAAHEIMLASEALASLPRRGSVGASGDSRNVPGSIRDDRDDFSFQRSFLRARAELLQLLGASWGMCQVSH